MSVKMLFSNVSSNELLYFFISVFILSKIVCLNASLSINPVLKVSNTCNDISALSRINSLANILTPIDAAVLLLGVRASHISSSCCIFSTSDTCPSAHFVKSLYFIASDFS